MLLAALKIFTPALSISTVKTFSPANKRMLRRSIAHSKQVGIKMGKVNHPVLESLRHSEIGFLTRIEGLNEVRRLKNQVSASRTIVKTRVVQEFVPDVKRGFYNKRAYG
jgi:hypothetical protein